MNIRKYLKVSLIFSFGLASATYLLLHLLGKTHPWASREFELWQKIAVFLIFFGPYFLATIGTQIMCREGHTGIRRIAILLSASVALIAVYFANEESRYPTNFFIAFAAWYVSGALVALSAIYLVLRWLANGFITREP